MMQAEEKGFRQSYKFRLYPTNEQIRYFQMNFGCCRYVYNYYLDARIKAYEAYKADPVNAKPLSLFDTTKDLTRLKRETIDENGHPWLKDADAVALVYALRNLDSAYQNFFRRVKKGDKPGFPKFKSRHASKQSFKTKPTALGEGWIKLPKAGCVRAKTHRAVEGEIVSVTISHNAADQYFATVNVKGVEKEPLPECSNEVGIALGVSRWCVTSDGEVIDNPRPFKGHAKKLAREQRRLARKQPGSANYQKQRLKVARLQAKIAHIREHETHELTRRLIDENGLIVSREMGTQSMMQRAKPKAHKINRSLADANFAEINRQLAYKAEWAGRTFVLVPHDMPTAQVCHACGYKHTLLASSLKPEWKCPQCHAVHERKYNGACNILEAGLDILHDEEKAAVTKAAQVTREKMKKYRDEQTNQDEER